MLTITIARELGSGGLEVANQVAKRLNIACMDRQIITRIAIKAGVRERDVEELDEKRPSLVKRVLELMGKYGDLGMYSEWGGPSSFYVPPQQRYPVIDPDSYRQLVEEAIRNIADRQSAVIIGRAGQVILRDHPHSLHVRIVGDFHSRVRRVMEREELDRREAEKLIVKVDSQRSGYLKNYYKVDWENPQLYHLVLNSSHMGIQGCADIIVRAALQKDRLSANQSINRSMATMAG